MNDINLEMQPKIRRRGCLTLRALLLNLLVFAAALVVGYWLVDHRSAPRAWDTPHHGPSLPSPASRGIPDKSIAVLPFQNLNGDQQNSYFGEGVREKIFSKLAKVTDLKVISSSDVMQGKAILTRTPREIGRQLGAAYLLEGSVERTENHVRVHVQLIDVEKDTTVWAETYDREFPMMKVKM